MYRQAVENQRNTNELLKQITGNFNPQQKQQFISQAKQMGFSDDLLNQI